MVLIDAVDLNDSKAQEANQFIARKRVGDVFGNGNF
jgi:hypothetical protein